MRVAEGSWGRVRNHAVGVDGDRDHLPDAFGILLDRAIAAEEPAAGGIQHGHHAPPSCLASFARSYRKASRRSFGKSAAASTVCFPFSASQANPYLRFPLTSRSPSVSACIAISFPCQSEYARLSSSACREDSGSPALSYASRGFRSRPEELLIRSPASLFIGTSRCSRITPRS